MELKQQLDYFRGILLQKLTRVQEKEGLVEVMLVLSVGMLAGLYNPHQVAQQLNITPKQFYQQLKEMSLYHWRTLLVALMRDKAITELKRYQSSNEVKQSRMQVSISVDDSLIKRLGEYLAYVWSWYSGQIHQVTKGQDLLGIVLKIDQQIIPLSLVLVSKQGCANTDKPTVLLRELSSLKASLLQAGIDITRFGISFDSWWLSQDIIRELTALGFHKQVICGKQVTKLKVAGEEKNLAAHYLAAKDSDELVAGWGHVTPAKRLKGVNSELGKIVVVLFNKARSNAFAIVMPDAALRTCEALRIWFNHPAVETFWKRLKHWLGQGQMHLQKTAGAWAELFLRVLAYFLALSLFDKEVRTFDQLYHWLRRQSTFNEFIREHFHPVFLVTYAIIHS